jgi:TolB-like protein/DNA-binding winged helix-turn-helix (wHTH) protein/tetratricopeptide (TPR) repeat protein
MPDILDSMTVTYNEPLQIGDWLVDPRDDSLTRGAERVKIEPRTMRLLMRLAQSPGTVISQDELMESVWSGLVVGTASIYQSASQLRKVLGDGDDPPRYIETVARKGYRLIAPVAPAAPRPVPQGAGVPAAGSGPERRAPTWPWVVLASISGLFVMAAVWRFAPPLDSSPERASIVVLPFMDLTSGRSEQSFCDGLTEETSSWLAQIPTLRVVARTSAFGYRDKEDDIRTIGRELQTSHVLRGSLRRSGNHMRITVALIDTRQGENVWSDSYDVEVGDVLRVQEEVARSVAGSLELRITADTERRLAGRRSGSPEAQRLYLIAKSHTSRFEGPSNEQAIALYRQALEADPTFALAKIWLAFTISNRRYFTSEPVASLMKQVEPLLADAARTAPELTDLYVVRGEIANDNRQTEAALKDLQHALELEPNSRSAAGALAYYHLTNAAPRDAVTYYTIAVGIDPRAFLLHANNCLALAQLAQFQAADAACAHARALGPESPVPFSNSSALEAARGRMSEALRWSDIALQRGRDIAAIYGERSTWLLALGLPGEAGLIYESALAATGPAANRNLALIHAACAAAIERGGTDALHAFFRDSSLSDSKDPAALFVMANAALMVRDTQLANELIARAQGSPLLQLADVESGWQAMHGTSFLLVRAAALQAAGNIQGATHELDALAGLLDRLVNAGVQTRGLYELQAQLAAMRSQPDTAMAALRRAVELGWTDVWLAEHQPYFDSLRARADFRELLAAVSARNATTAASLKSRLLAVGGEPG